jgi:hypothetical protein
MRRQSDPDAFWRLFLWFVVIIAATTATITTIDIFWVRR